MTARRENACLGPPKRRHAAYPHRPGPAPGRTPRRARTTADRQHVRVLLPDEPPRLTPAAARALLRILVEAHTKAMDEDRRKEDRP